MRKISFLIISMLLLGCILTICIAKQKNDYMFTYNDAGNLVSKDGIEYTQLDNEQFLMYFGELEFFGSVKGEPKSSSHLFSTYEVGMFSLKGDTEKDLLIRYRPNNEWYSIYRKTSLPSIDLSFDNCYRLEFISNPDFLDSYVDGSAKHVTCDQGIFESSEILDFFTNVKAQNNPRDEGLYELVTRPNKIGYENLHSYGHIYAYFKEEPRIARSMTIMSFNDLGYYITIEGEDYVLPAKWLKKVESLCH